jgi:hypothetical protein
LLYAAGQIVLVNPVVFVSEALKTLKRIITLRDFFQCVQGVPKGGKILEEVFIIDLIAIGQGFQLK